MANISEPLVSVNIPVYNGEKILRECLDSVLNQTYKNFEVIVVDNNSSDGTKKIINEYKRNDKRIRYVFEKIKGRGAARNAAVKASKGKIITMTDVDCIVPNNWIEELVKPMIFEKEVAVLGFVEDIKKNYWTKNMIKNDLEYFYLNITGKYINHIACANFACKSYILKDLTFDPKINNFEDFDLYLRFNKIAKIRFLSSLSVKHYYKNTMRQTIITYFDRGFWVYKIFQKHKKSLNNTDEPMFESVSILNNLSFPFWLIIQLLTKPLKETYFRFISEVSWRVGLLSGILTGFIKKLK